MYLGTDGTQPKQGSFLLVIGHMPCGLPEQQLHRHLVECEESHGDAAERLRDGLILQGWKEVVPHSGARRSSGSSATSDDGKQMRAAPRPTIRQSADQASR